MCSTFLKELASSTVRSEREGPYPVYSPLSLRIRDNCLVREEEGRGKTRESARSFLMSFLFRSSSFPLGPSVVEIHWERENKLRKRERGLYLEWAKFGGIGNIPPG